MSTYYDQQLDRFIEKAKKSKYNSTIKIFDGEKNDSSNHIAVTASQLERIKDILNDTEEFCEQSFNTDSWQYETHSCGDAFNLKHDVCPTCHRTVKILRDKP